MRQILHSRKEDFLFKTLGGNLLSFLLPHILVATYNWNVENELKLLSKLKSNENTLVEKVDGKSVLKN